MDNVVDDAVGAVPGRRAQGPQLFVLASGNERDRLLGAREVAEDSVRRGRAVTLPGLAVGQARHSEVIGRPRNSIVEGAGVGEFRRIGIQPVAVVGGLVVVPVEGLGGRPRRCFLLCVVSASRRGSRRRGSSVVQTGRTRPGMGRLAKGPANGGRRSVVSGSMRATPARAGECRRRGRAGKVGRRSPWSGETGQGIRRPLNQKAREVSDVVARGRGSPRAIAPHVRRLHWPPRGPPSATSPFDPAIVRQGAANPHRQHASG